MAWITPANLKLNFAPVKDLTTAQAQEAINAAVDELIELVGQSAADDAALEVPTDAVRAERLIRGHKYLAVSIGVWNTKNIKRQQDPSSPATSQTITNEVWNPKDLQIVSDFWRDKAIKAVSVYLTEESESEEITIHQPARSSVSSAKVVF